MISKLCCTKQNQVSQQAWYLPWPLASEARSFRSAAPTLWNRLPDMLQQAKDRASFQQRLKSLLFLSPSPHPTPLPFPMSSSIIPPPLHLFCQVQWTCVFFAWSQTALNKWMLMMIFFSCDVIMHVLWRMSKRPQLVTDRLWHLMVSHTSNSILCYAQNLFSKFIIKSFGALKKILILCFCFCFFGLLDKTCLGKACSFQSKFCRRQSDSNTSLHTLYILKEKDLLMQSSVEE